jgi:hypothetical protein
MRFKFDLRLYRPHNVCALNCLRSKGRRTWRNYGLKLRVEHFTSAKTKIVLTQRPSREASTALLDLDKHELQTVAEQEGEKAVPVSFAATVMAGNQAAEMAS